MTIPEAAQLVIQTGSMGLGGDEFVLNTGYPMVIFFSEDLTRAILYGLKSSNSGIKVNAE